MFLLQGKVSLLTMSAVTAINFVCVYVCMYVCMCACMYVRTYVYVCVQVIPALDKFSPFLLVPPIALLKKWSK